MVWRVKSVTLWVGVNLLSTQALAQDIWAVPGQTAAETQASAAAAAEAPRAPEATAGEASEAAPSAADEAVDSSLAEGSYGERVLHGLRQLVLRDFDGALSTLRAAAQLEPASPAAYCHLGEAQIGRADWIEARAAFDSCGRFAELSRDERYTTLALVGAARVAELSQVSLNERRDMYVRLAASSASAAAKELATARLAVLDRLIALEAEYDGVRRRIAQRQTAKQTKR